MTLSQPSRTQRSFPTMALSKQNNFLGAWKWGEKKKTSKKETRNKHLRVSWPRCIATEMLPWCYFGVHCSHQCASMWLKSWDSLICVHAPILPVVQADQISHHNQTSFLENENEDHKTEASRRKEKGLYMYPGRTFLPRTSQPHPNIGGADIPTFTG